MLNASLTNIVLLSGHEKLTFCAHSEVTMVFMTETDTDLQWSMEFNYSDTVCYIISTHDHANFSLY